MRLALLFSLVAGLHLAITTIPVSAQNAPPGGTSLARNVAVRPLTSSTWLVESVSEMTGFGPVSSNAVLIVGRQGSVLVDVPATVEQTDVVLSWAETTLRHPVRAVIATHAHSDRIGGLPAAQRRRIPTYALALTIDLAPKNGFAAPEHELPENGEVTLAGQRLDVFYPGPGHSPDNIVVWHSQDSLLIGACLLKTAAARGIGFTGDADLAGWRRALVLVTKRYPTAAIVVPGHGAIGGPELLNHTAEIVDAAIAAAAEKQRLGSTNR